MRGRKPKPTVIRGLQGNVGHRRRNRAEPQFSPAGLAECPGWLSDAANAEWRRVAPQLASMGLLTVVDVAALAGYCTAYAHWQEAEAFIAAHGMTYEVRDDKGVFRGTYQVPQVGIALKMLDKVRQFAAEFGFTPSARGRIEITSAGGRGVEEESDDEKLRAELEEIEREIAGEKGRNPKPSVQ